MMVLVTIKMHDYDINNFKIMFIKINNMNIFIEKKAETK